MAFLKVSIFLFVLLHAIVMLSSLVHCDDEDVLLQGINNYRRSLHLPALNQNENAGCLADEVADKVLEDLPCTSANGTNIVQLDKYPDLLSKCDIDIEHTRDGAVLPVCVPNLDPTQVLNKYTHTTYTRYLNNPKFTGAGVGSENNWMVVILSTNTPGGSFARVNNEAY